MNAGCDNFAAKNCAVVAVLVAAGLASETQAQLPCQYEVIATIQGPNCQFVGPTYLQAEAISPNGLYITGWYAQCGVTAHEAFLWIGPPPGVRIKIPRPVGIESAKGYDVNDSGVVTGLCYQSDAMRGFVWKYQSGQWITLEPSQPGGEVQPYAINNASTVVGYQSIRNNVVPREAFIWNETTGFQGLGVMIGPGSGASDISENGIVVGWTGTNTGSPTQNGARAFVYSNGTTTVLGPVPGGISSMASHVNSSGRVAIRGKTQLSPAQYASYMYVDGVMTPLSVPTGFDWSAVYGMSDSGIIVGDCGDYKLGVSPATVWNGSNSLVLQGNVSPPIVDFVQTNYAPGATMDGNVLVAGRTTQNIAAGFLLRPTPPLPGDTNCDRIVNIDDLVNVIVSWGSCAGCATDFDANGQVDIDDLVTVITHWSP